MKARTSEVARIKSPIKKQIKHLGGSLQEKFPELLGELVGRLRDEGYKLVHVTKSYRKNGSERSDSFWKKRKKFGNVEVVWLCKLTPVFDSGFEFHFDFYFWFEFSKLIQNLKGCLYESGFPRTDREYARKFGEKEANRILEEIEEEMNRVMREKAVGWGRHGITDEVTERKSSFICHHRELSLSAISEVSKLRSSLREITQEPIDLIEEEQDEIERFAREELNGKVPFQIESESLEGYLAFFLWIRKPGGGFEFQLYRFVQENFEERVEKEDIRDALLKLEVHGYVDVKATDQEVMNRLSEVGVRRSKRFYEAGGEDIPGRRLFNDLKRKVDIGAYLSPLPRKRLIKSLNVPDYKVQKSLRELRRKNYVNERRVRDYRGRTVKKVKPRRSPRNLSGIKERIMDKCSEFYEVQKSSLDEMQEERPNY